MTSEILCDIPMLNTLMIHITNVHMDLRRNLINACVIIVFGSIFYNNVYINSNLVTDDQQLRIYNNCPLQVNLKAYILLVQIPCVPKIRFSEVNL